MSTAKLSDEELFKKARDNAIIRDGLKSYYTFNGKFDEESFAYDFADNFANKIKYDGKETRVIGNAEGMSIRELLLRNVERDINYNDMYYIILGNITDSTFSVMPLLPNVESGKIEDAYKSYYRNVIINKSFNDANINFCNEDNVLFIIGNREIDKIKIHSLSHLNDNSGIAKDYNNPTGDNFNYLTVELYKKIQSFNFSIKPNNFYPFWVKYYFTIDDKYKIKLEYKFLKQFQKIFKSIDAEMLLFTIPYEIFFKKDENILEQLANLAFLYFHTLNNLNSKSFVPNVNRTKFVELNNYEQLDFLAFFTLGYFRNVLSEGKKLHTLLLKAEFIKEVQIHTNFRTKDGDIDEKYKSTTEQYLLFSHGGYFPKMTYGKVNALSVNAFSEEHKKLNKKDRKDLKKLREERPIVFENLISFISRYQYLLTNIECIKKTPYQNKYNLLTQTKREQSQYYEKKLELNTDDKCVKITHDTIIPTIDPNKLNIKLMTIEKYNKLLGYLYSNNQQEIDKLKHELANPIQAGGYFEKINDFAKDYLTDKYSLYDQINIYNDYLCAELHNVLDNPITKDTPTTTHLLLILLAHNFNSKIFGELLDPTKMKTTNGIKIEYKQDYKIKSKDFSVLINTIYDHRVNAAMIKQGSNPPSDDEKYKYQYGKKLHQIIANSNNTAQFSEAIIDSIFYGTIVDCYKTPSKGIINKEDLYNYVISVDNSSFIKYTSNFKSKTMLIFCPNFRYAMGFENIAIYSYIDNMQMEIFTLLLDIIYYYYNLLLDKSPSCKKKNLYGIRDTIIYSDAKIEIKEYKTLNL